MIIYNQTPTSKKYVSGVLMGVLIGPAIYLFTLGYIFYGIILILIYLAFETTRTGVHFDFDNARFTGFREIMFFIKMRKGESANLNTFSHYRVKEDNDAATVSANWAQYATISQEHHTLELFDKRKGEFLPIVKSDAGQVQPLLTELEAQNIILKD